MKKFDFKTLSLGCLMYLGGCALMTYTYLQIRDFFKGEDKTVTGFYSSSNEQLSDVEPSDEEEGTVGELVLICTSETSHAYHYYMDCMGLHSCKAGIDEITLEEAKRKGRTPCHFCREREATELDY